MKKDKENIKLIPVKVQMKVALLVKSAPDSNLFKPNIPGAIEN